MLCFHCLYHITLIAGWTWSPVSWQQFKKYLDFFSLHWDDSFLRGHQVSMWWLKRRMKENGHFVVLIQQSVHSCFNYIYNWSFCSPHILTTFHHPVLYIEVAHYSLGWPWAPKSVSTSFAFIVVDTSQWLYERVKKSCFLPCLCLWWHKSDESTVLKLE